MLDVDYHRALSKDELKQAVSKQFRTSNVSVLNYHLSPVGDKPLGFMGVHFKITGEASINGSVTKFQYFAKKIPEDVPTHHAYATDVGAFFKEVQFYETVVEDTRQNLTGKHKKWCPEFFFSRGDQIIVIEDLSVDKYYMYPERTMLELDYVLATVKAMAAMHAAPLILMAKLDAATAPHPPSNWLPGHSAQLSLLYNHIIYETESCDIPGHFGNRFYRAGIKSQVPIVDLLPGYSTEQRENIKKHLPDVLYRMLELAKPSTTYRNTFTHGDLWSNNIMFKDDEAGNVKDAIIIDFQIARYAPPGHDLAMFIHLVQNRAFREKHESHILECYYDSFSAEVTAEHLDVEVILPKEELFESYKHYYEFAILTKTFFYQLTLTPPHITAKFLCSPELFDQNFLEDRSEMILETYRTDSLCRERITESMQEVIEFHRLDDLDHWKDVTPKLKLSELKTKPKISEPAMLKDRDYNKALSGEEVKQAVCRQFNRTDISIEEYQLLQFSDKPLGFLGIHFKVVGKAMINNKIEKFQYFAKKIPEDVQAHNAYATDCGAFFKEVQFYETVVEDTKRNLTGKHKKWCPDFLFSRNDQILVCEDLSVGNYYMHAERQMMGLNYILATLKTLAAMHAAPLMLKAKLESSTAPHPPPNWIPGQSADLSLLYNHILYETEATDIPGHCGNIFYRAGIKSQLVLVDLIPGYTVEQRKNIKKHLPDVLYRVLELVKPSTKYRNTFLHGDLWANNVMFADDDSGQVRDAIIIDFQLARYAPPSHELAMFIHLVQDRAFREAHESDIIEYYYECFTEEVEAEGLDVETILPKEELLESYKYYYEFAVLTKTIFYQFALATPDIMAKFLSTPELFNRSFLVDRSELILETYLNDELCRNRMNESMEEIIQFHQLDDVEKWKDVVPQLNF